MTNETNTSNAADTSTDTSTDTSKTDAQKAYEKREESRAALVQAVETLSKRVRTRFVLNGGSQADAPAFVSGYVQAALIALVMDRPSTKQAAAVSELTAQAGLITDEIAALIEAQAE